MAMLTYQLDSRLLGFVWCFPEFLYKAARIQGQSVYTYHRNNGIRHTLPWWPRNGCLRQALSPLSPIYHLDRLAVVYPRTHRWLFCE